MTKVIIWENGEGGVYTTTPSDQNNIDNIRNELVPSDAQSFICDASELSDRKWIKSWVMSGGKIEINTAKARDVYREHIRAVRPAFFEVLDRDSVIATENNDLEKRAEIVNKKNILRNLPTSIEIENAKSIEELKGLWDTTLLGKSPFSVSE